MATAPTGPAVQWACVWVSAVCYDTPEGRARLKATVGPSGATLSHAEIKASPDARQWRVLDDDGEVYARGYAVGDVDGEDGFAPLDGWAQPMFGCTEIQYQSPDGAWQTL
jgi:hypothetical protein